MKSIFEDFAGELSTEEYKALIAWLKLRKYAYLAFSLRHPFDLCLKAMPERRLASGAKLKKRKTWYGISCGEAIAEEERAIAEVMNLLEAKPATSEPGLSGISIVHGPDIPALREQLAVLMLTGKCKEAISVALMHEQVKQLTDKEVKKYSKRYETYVGSKTTESLIDSFI